MRKFLESARYVRLLPWQMSRRSRVVIPGFPHHVTQRGNNRRDVFFSEADRATYLNLLRKYCSKYGVGIVGYCLMTNHIHLIATPQRENSLAKALGGTHNDYSRWLNVSRLESGHVWQSRFYSCPLERRHLWAALAYAERNPVRAGIVAAAEEWRWSSAAAHLDSARCANQWLQMAIWQENWSPKAWRIALTQGLNEASFQARLVEATRTGRPLGDEAFVEVCERQCGTILRPQKRGPRAKSAGEEAAVLALRAANLELW
jgi:putative transposase